MTVGIWRWSSWRFKRCLGVALLWTLLLAGIAAFVNIVGLGIVGSINGWSHWLRAHSTHFFIWRLLLYAATAYGWYGMRQRLRQREPAAGERLLRAEIAAVTAIVLLEAGQLLGNG